MSALRSDMSGMYATPGQLPVAAHSRGMPLESRPAGHDHDASPVGQLNDSRRSALIHIQSRTDPRIPAPSSVRRVSASP